MACNCIDLKEKELQEKTGDNEAFLSTVLDFKHNLRRFNAKGFYRGKMFNHFKKNFLLSYIPFEYCPFCGKKYVEEV